SCAASQPITVLNKMVGTLPINGSGTTNGFSQAVVTPIIAMESIRGYCLLLRQPTNANQGVSAVEEIAVSQGAAAAALEWAKLNAVGLAEERMRAAFVDELLASEIADETAWIQRGASLNYDLTRPHVAWVIEAKHISEWPNVLARFIKEQGVDVPLSRRDEGTLLFWPTDNPKSGRELKVIANTLAEKVQAQYPKAKIVIGIGRPGVSPGKWLQSQQQARESWRLGKEWKGAPVTYFGDLGLYQLLTTLGNSNEASRFYRKTLGRLLAYDEDKNAELVQTLEAFFECHGNLSQTALRLHIHRNTLTYRLEQISTITQLDLDDPDARFSLQFALKLRPVVKPG
ncbi:MAG: helix-turn-helix domain-containing protein, partial [Caldilineaceae bacterium]|nr:helix-turn-helix domain-containing protein [Caldilineaceae bacterium]